MTSAVSSQILRKNLTIFWWSSVFPMKYCPKSTTFDLCFRNFLVAQTPDVWLSHWLWFSVLINVMNLSTASIARFFKIFLPRWRIDEFPPVIPSTSNPPCKYLSVHSRNRRPKVDNAPASQLPSWIDYLLVRHLIIKSLTSGWGWMVKFNVYAKI